MGRKKNEAQRERILKYARRLLLESGYEKVSIRMIAAEAGIAPALVQHYFHRKETILRDVVFDLITSCFEYIKETVDKVGTDLYNGLFYRLFYEVLSHDERLMNIYVAVLQNASVLCQGTKYTIESRGQKVVDNIGLFVLNGTFSQLIMLRRSGDLDISIRDTVNTALYTYYRFKKYRDGEIEGFISVCDNVVTDEFIRRFIDRYEAQMRIE